MSGTEGVMAVSIEEWNAKNAEIERLRDERDEWRQAAQVEAGLRREFLAKVDQLTNEIMEQAHLNGERELGLRAEVERLQAAHERLRADEIATLMTLLKAASYHVEGDGGGGAALLVKIRAALEPKP